MTPSSEDLKQVANRKKASQSRNYTRGLVFGALGIGLTAFGVGEVAHSGVNNTDGIEIIAGAAELGLGGLMLAGGSVYGAEASVLEAEALRREYVEAQMAPSTTENPSA